MTDTPTPADATEADKPKAPFLTVLKGNPDDVQVATLTAVFAQLANNAAGAAAPERDRNMWGNLEERLRRPVTYNPTSFRNVSFY
ncbi:acyl-CoA carboxylase subunit epsilon [Corynebacterium sp. 13CS0277]|uniref:acyl-CoA carboxylase subunit epsilon n=1 Tax=Corynebacterium sp. 13CS0277 TaxID=2071994 RepID=UPI000D042FAF|nr:acyl-CoA carboxylase subunit epsilon [Corynebacterium sp. 13CS0277]PRQ10394.1 acyl-CoA carboxylase subunit epsilon [Corynebacterium sp. 13CS0277]